MRVLLLLLIPFLSLSSAYGETFHCRDKQGHLHITDNIQALPEECRQGAQSSGNSDPDNLNYVPAQKTSKDVKRRFLREIQEEEEKNARQKARGEELLQRAERAAANFEQAVKEKRQALRRWTYQSREIIKDADERMAKAREQKNRLIGELEGARLDKDVREAVLSALNRITEKQ